MEYLVIANSVTAMTALTCMMFVTRGYGPHMRLRGHDATSLIHIFVTLSSSLVWVRLLWWDLARPVLGIVGLMRPMVLSPTGAAMNTAFNLWAICAALSALAALFHSLPVAERKGYNWFSVVRYPRRGLFLKRIV